MYKDELLNKVKMIIGSTINVGDKITDEKTEKLNKKLAAFFKEKYDEAIQPIKENKEHVNNK